MCDLQVGEETHGGAAVKKAPAGKSSGGGGFPEETRAGAMYVARETCRD